MSSDIQAFVDTNDATAVAAAVRGGELDPKELIEVALARLDERDPELNAMVATCPDEARADAATVDMSAPFAGVPFVVKDLGAEVGGLPSTKGSRLHADDVAAEDSELVKRYRRAGFVIIGTTNTPEMGKSASTEPLLHGPTRNPYGLGYSTGGSSGGTAAAIAAGIVPIGHGNDGGGSIRIPSSACGLVGLKPSRGRTTAAPDLSLLSYPLGISHVLARSLRDSARALDATAGPMLGDPYEVHAPSSTWESALAGPGRPLRVGVSTRDRLGEPIHPDNAAAVAALADLLSDLGHEVVEASPSYPNEAFTYVMSIVAPVATKVNVDDRLAELGREIRDDDLEPFTRLLYDGAGTQTGEQVLRAFREIERASRAVGQFYTDHDVLLTATLAKPTPELGYLDPSDPMAMVERAGAYSILTSPFNVTGQPAISLPTATDSGGRPLGTQLVAAFGREDLLVALGAQVEEAQPWSIEPQWPAIA